MKQDASFDSSFWINAHRCGLLPCVLERYELHCPSAVAAEMQASFPSGQEFWRLARSGALREMSAAQSRVQEFGPGERAAMDLALEHPDWVLLMDDHRPLQHAAGLGLSVVCTPVFTLALYSEGALSAEEALLVLARLAALQTVSPSLLAAALAHLGRSLASEES